VTQKATGFIRFYYATRYSLQGIRAAYKNEPAFRYESWAAAVMLPLSVLLAQSGMQLAALVGTVLMVLIFELINTAIEAVVDRAGTERNELAGLAKDLGSAAVFFMLIITAITWLGVCWDNGLLSLS